MALIEDSSCSFVCWKDDDVIILSQRFQCCKLISCQFGFRTCVLRITELKSARMVSASSVGIPAKTVSILTTSSTAGTVILNKEDYIRKCNEHLENGPYIKIKKDPTSSVVSQKTRKLSVLRDNKLIDQHQYLKLKQTGSQPPWFYGLPKIHKDGIPVRPMVSYTGTPLYKVSKYIAEILEPYGKQKNNI